MKSVKKAIVIFIAVVMMFGIGINQNVKAESCHISNPYISVKVGHTYCLKVLGTSKKVKWSSSNKSIATVNTKGIVTGKKPGKVIISAKVSGRSYLCRVTVKPKGKTSISKQSTNSTVKKKSKNQIVLPES